MSQFTITNRATHLRRAKLAQARMLAPPAVVSRKPATRSTYTALLACLNEGIEDPRQNELASVADISTASVIRALFELTEAGLVRSERTNGIGAPNRYELANLDEVAS